MKKLFFTAIALVAFMSNVNANQPEKKPIAYMSCMAYATIIYTMVIEAGGSSAEAAEFSNASYGSCLEQEASPIYGPGF